MTVRELLNIGLLTTGIAVGHTSQATVSLPAYMSDNMVIQQNSLWTISGHARPGKTVEARFGWDAETYSTAVSTDGSFRLTVAVPAASGPYAIRFSDGEERILDNVLIGEVWLCSGQSNMEMPVAGWGKVQDYEQELAECDYPSIRLLQIKKTTATVPTDDIEVNMNGWQPCNATSVAGFSAIAYFYARSLQKELDIPVGVIDCTWGGTPAEAWVSQETINDVPGYENLAFPIRPGGSRTPTVLYNAMIHPLTSFPIRGVIWYQGEANVGRASQYAPLFRSLITDWREHWKKEFPFYFVQLAGYRPPDKAATDTSWAELREAQAEALVMSQTGMAVAIDIGEAADIHPKNKQEAARRLALLALKETYGRDCVAQAPALSRYRVKGRTVLLDFDADLQTGNRDIKGFTVVNPDGTLQATQARRKGKRTVVLEYRSGNTPTAIRYNWGNCPDGNLRGKTGLPVAPFRTDRQPTDNQH